MTGARTVLVTGVSGHVASAMADRRAGAVPGYCPRRTFGQTIAEQPALAGSRHRQDRR
jgi:hypothetical protein